MLALLADVGGTKTQLALLNESLQLEYFAQYQNDAFMHFYDVIADYFRTINNATLVQSLQTAVIAVAGPVDYGIRCQMTNTPWLIDGNTLQEQFNIKSVQLINDLQATAWGLTPSESCPPLAMLRGNYIDYTQPVLVVSPGTGFGQTCIYPFKGGFSIHATEGGHKTVAPFNTKVAKLLLAQWQQHNQPVSWENWFSGSGLQRLYQALHSDQKPPKNEIIGQLAIKDPKSDAGRCIELFTQGIYAEAGNLILQYLAWGGVIIAGGIPPKVKSFFQQAVNIEYIHQKNEYIQRLQQVPIALCEQANAPLQGAAIYYKNMHAT